jgi:hypothetical protein
VFPGKSGVSGLRSDIGSSIVGPIVVLGPGVIRGDRPPPDAGEGRAGTQVRLPRKFMLTGGGAPLIGIRLPSALALGGPALDKGLAWSLRTCFEQDNNGWLDSLDEEADTTMAFVAAVLFGTAPVLTVGG